MIKHTSTKYNVISLYYQTPKKIRITVVIFVYDVCNVIFDTVGSNFSPQTMYYVT